jgi:hypothetical protein
MKNTFRSIFLQSGNFLALCSHNIYELAGATGVYVDFLTAATRPALSVTQICKSLETNLTIVMERGWLAKTPRTVRPVPEGPRAHLSRGPSCKTEFG